MSRRCLQAILRNFYGAVGGTLSQEIDNVKSKFESRVHTTMHSIKDIGNQGAHAEKDINIMVEISEKDAQNLTNFIHLLIKQTYIERYEDQLAHQGVEESKENILQSKKVVECQL